MGLDTVEIVMNVEDAFSVTIPDDDAARIQTVGELYEFVVSKLASQSVRSRVGGCASARRFREIRRDLQAEFALSRGAIRPSARIGDLIPPGSPRVRWGEFARQHTLPKPPFSFFPVRRFPAPETTLRELVDATTKGNYFTPSGEVDVEKVWKKVLMIVSYQAGVRLEELHRNTHFINDLNLD